MFGFPEKTKGQFLRNKILDHQSLNSEPLFSKDIKKKLWDKAYTSLHQTHINAKINLSDIYKVYADMQLYNGLMYQVCNKKQKK